MNEPVTPAEEPLRKAIDSLEGMELAQIFLGAMVDKKGANIATAEFYTMYDQMLNARTVTITGDNFDILANSLAVYAQRHPEHDDTNEKIKRSTFLKMLAGAAIASAGGGLLAHGLKQPAAAKDKESRRINLKTVEKAGGVTLILAGGAYATVQMAEGMTQKPVLQQDYHTMLFNLGSILDQLLHEYEYNQRKPNGQRGIAT